MGQNLGALHFAFYYKLASSYIQMGRGAIPSRVAPGHHYYSVQASVSE